MSIIVRDLTVRGGRLSFRVEGGPSDQLWYDVGEDYQSWLAADRYDVAAVALLPYAMKTGKPIQIMGGVSAHLLHNLRTGIVPILKEHTKPLKPVAIDATMLEQQPEPGQAVVAGLSCGIDSLSTTYMHLDHDVPGLRITHFSFHDVGSHLSETTFTRRLAHVRRAASEFDRPLIVVRSNLPAFHAHRFQPHHTLWNSSVAIALGKGVGTFLYSSGVPYRELHVKGSSDTGFTDPIILPLLSASGVHCVSANAHLSRVEKTALIADWHLAQRWLDVCLRSRDDGRNCSTCWKCCRTILTLELLGKLDAFQDRFNLARYRAVRADFVAKLLDKRLDPLAREVLDLAREQGVKLGSLRCRLEALGRRWFDRSTSLMPRKVRRRLRLRRAQR